jgi:hypothetical protein
VFVPPVIVALLPIEPVPAAVFMIAPEVRAGPPVIIAFVPIVKEPVLSFAKAALGPAINDT